MSENSLYSLRWIKVVEALFEKLLQSVLHDILYLFKQLFDLGTNSLSFREEDSHSLVCSIVRFHVLLFQTWRGNRIMSWNAVRSHLSSKSLLKFKVTLHWKGGLIGGNLNACSQGSLQAYYIYIIENIIVVLQLDKKDLIWPLRFEVHEGSCECYSLETERT